MEVPAANGTSEHITVVAVSCGSSHSVALLDCDAVVSWGRGEDGQLGHGNAEECQAPKAIYGLLNAGVSQVCCGAEYTVAVSRRQQEVYSWGWGDFGRLGHGNCSDLFVPQRISLFTGKLVKHVACGDTHTLVVLDSGELYSFGRNQNGQLGLGTTEDALSPVKVTSMEGHEVVSVACGAEHSLCCTSAGEAFSWGWGRYGNLGDGERCDRHLPSKVLGLEGARVASVACGWRHSAVVDSAGRVFTFGWSKYGQLGHGDCSDALVPKEVAALQGKSIAAVAGGWRHTMAADSSGCVYAWGWNKFGQLGLGDTEDRVAPCLVRALGAEHVVLLACGWRHTVAVSSGGTVYSWGRGVNGQLGHGDELDVHVPKALEALSRGRAQRSALLATAQLAGSYVAPADRYAVVPGGEEGANGAAGGSSGSSGPELKRQRVGGADAAVPVV